MSRRLSLPSMDPFLIWLVGVVALASILRARGVAAGWFAIATDLAIALLFFLHRAKLSRTALADEIGNWRLHALVVALTYALFPIAGLVVAALIGAVIDLRLAAGFLFLMLVRAKNGQFIPVGGLWEKTSNNGGGTFLQGQIHDPSFEAPLVKTVFPLNYRGRDYQAQEQQAYGDLRQIIEQHELHYFCTFDTERSPHGAAMIKAVLWSCFPFDLAGRKPCLNAANWIDVGEGLSMRIEGAELIENESIDIASLHSGQILGCQGHLRALARHDSEVVVHLYNGSKLIYEQVFPHDYIFKRYGARAAR